jgi:hypothetical protein
MLPLAHVLRALEHHVLEEVSKPGLAGALIAGADVIGDCNRKDWCAMVGRDDNAQPVLETLVSKVQPGDLRLPGDRRDNPKKQSEDQTLKAMTSHGKYAQKPKFLALNASSLLC